jgi:hypothetical protein
MVTGPSLFRSMARELGPVHHTSEGRFASAPQHSGDRVITPRYYWSPVGEQTPRDGSYRMAQASGAVRQIGVSSQQHAARY